MKRRQERQRKKKRLADEKKAHGLKQRESWTSQTGHDTVHDGRAAKADPAKIWKQGKI